MSQRTPLAWHNLTHSPGRLIVSMGGIGFAVVLMFMQLGFLGSVGDTATVVLDRMTASPQSYDLVIRSPDYLHLYDAGLVDDQLVDVVTAVEGVVAATPFDISVTRWQNPATFEFREIAIMGIDLDRPGLSLPALSGSINALLRPTGHVLIDDASSPDFVGPIDRQRFGPAEGIVADVMGREARLVGTFQMGTGLAAKGALLTSRATFDALTPVRRGERTSMVLVKLESNLDPASMVPKIQSRLRSLAGPIAASHVLTLDQAKQMERDVWYFQTPIGLIFFIGVGLAGVVGSVIAYLVLASDVQSHLSEYATLRAMGYRDRYLASMLLGQSTLLALMSFPPAFALSCLLYLITGRAAALPIQMTWLWFGIVLLLSLVMCNIAGLLALRRLLKAEPASLF